MQHILEQPTSSFASLSAVATSSESPGSRFPPGRHTWFTGRQTVGQVTRQAVGQRGNHSGRAMQGASVKKQFMYCSSHHPVVARYKPPPTNKQLATKLAIRLVTCACTHARRNCMRTLAHSLTQSWHSNPYVARHTHMHFGCMLQTASRLLRLDAALVSYWHTAQHSPPLDVLATKRTAGSAPHVQHQMRPQKEVPTLLHTWWIPAARRNDNGSAMAMPSLLHATASTFHVSCGFAWQLGVTWCMARQTSEEQHSVRVLPGACPARPVPPVSAAISTLCHLERLHSDLARASAHSCNVLVQSSGNGDHCSPRSLLHAGR